MYGFTMFKGNWYTWLQVVSTVVSYYTSVLQITVHTWRPVVRSSVNRLLLLHGWKAPLALDSQLQVLGQRLSTAQDLVSKYLSTELLQLNRAEGRVATALLSHCLRFHRHHGAWLSLGHLRWGRTPSRHGAWNMLRSRASHWGRVRWHVS